MNRVDGAEPNHGQDTAPKLAASGGFQESFDVIRHFLTAIPQLHRSI